MSAIFYQIFIFHQMIALQKLINVFHFIQKALFFVEIFKLFYFRLLLFFSLSTIAWEVDPRKTLVYYVINYLNKDLVIWNFVWYFEREIRRDIEFLSIDRVLNRGTFLWKNHAENMHQKLVPDPFLTFLDNLKQPLHARNSFKNKIFWTRIIGNPSKRSLCFFFRTQSLLKVH